MARNYSSIAEPKTLAANVAIDAVQITLNNVEGLPTKPYVLVLNPDTASEEAVLVTTNQDGVTSPTLKVQRAIETNATAKTHTSGQVVKHMIVGTDLQLAHDHIDNTTTAHNLDLKAPLASPTFTGTVVLPANTSIGTISTAELNKLDGLTVTTAEMNRLAGVTSSVVSVDNTQTLTSKTLTSPAISNPTISGTITGTGVVSSTNILDGTIVNDDINASAAIVATKLTGSINNFNTALTDADFATLANAETLTNKTLTSPKINENVAVTATATELNYVTGVTSAIQTQISAKPTLRYEGDIVNRNIGEYVFISNSKRKLKKRK